MDDLYEINRKILNGEELTEEEVKFIFWEYDSIEEIEGEHHRWYYEVTKIFQVEDKYFSVNALLGLTELQDNEYRSQTAIRVEPREKTIIEWVEVK